MGTKERKQRELEQRKLFIIEKSKELFFSKGFSNVTIQDICDVIEYGKSTVYNLFESKEEIYGYVYVEAVKILADLLNEIDIDKTSPEHTFETATKQIFLFYKNYRPYYKALFFFGSNHLTTHQIPEKILAAKYKERDRAMIPVRELLNRGISEKLLKKVDTGQVIETYFDSLLGIINSFIIEDETRKPELLYNILQNHAKIYDYGLLS